MTRRRAACGSRSTGGTPAAASTQLGYLPTSLAVRAQALVCQDWLRQALAESRQPLENEPEVPAAIEPAEPPEPPPPHSRIIKISDALMPKFPNLDVTYPACQQGFLRISSAIVFPETGVVMPELGVALRLVFVVDALQRPMRDLRISVTDRCNYDRVSFRIKNHSPVADA